MESIQNRAIALIYMTGLDDLVRKSEISYSRWKNLRHKKARISTEEIEVLVQLYPQYALWLASGRTIPESGQTSPDIDEAVKIPSTG
ncbi:hypothetical protein B8B80_00600 [Pseudomonas aeruginosa]|nr:MULTISPECIES: hypothetical protein [Pseudomonas]ASP05793.1 hypothetical protein CGU46_13195 [Pseudomonas aeruginosa]ASP12302.1 hypothetical protein CGU45_13635 [Pseudomonas aeruginosa]AVZ37055.1 hypothetical protein B8B76_28555 [Pseudomonas aeruginosa]KAA5632172.1 hypothetical protein F3G89_09200 [Pseudomonas aeruginosa]MCM8573166.1 hypothetical protein [Pseudomonas aeruginosa]